MSESTTIADRMRNARKAASLSQRELASLAGVGVSTITDIEQGVTADPRYSTVAAIMDAIRAYENTKATSPAARREADVAPMNGA